MRKSGTAEDGGRKTSGHVCSWTMSSNSKIIGMNETDLSARIERARKLKKEGFNCSQCVTMAFGDLLDLPERDLARLSVGFGGGLGGQRQICGALSGLSVVLGGLRYASVADKSAVYGEIRRCCSEFSDRNGSCICGELLAMGGKNCMERIEDAVAVLHRHLSGETE